MKIGRELDVENGELTRHLCDNPTCCNPYHLLEGNNYDDMVVSDRAYWQNKTGYSKRYNRKNSKKELLSKEKVIDIYKECLLGELSYAEIDKKYNLCRNTSCNIANKKTYVQFTKDLDIKDNRSKKTIENYIIVRNLMDGGIYNMRDISLLSGINRETVRSICNGSYHIKDDMIEGGRIVGDGSGVIYYMDVLYDSVVDGKGFRNVVFCAKCDVCCEGCHNKKCWDIHNGRPITVNKLSNLLMRGNKTNNVTFSGGECSLQSKAFLKLAKILKDNGKNIWMYSGKTFEHLVLDKNCKKLLEYIDVLVDGGFELDKRDITLPFRGSSNQRIIDVKESLSNNKTIIYNL